MPLWPTKSFILWSLKSIFLEDWGQTSSRFSQSPYELTYWLTYSDLLFHYWHVCLTRWWYIVSSSRLSWCPNKLQPCLIGPPCPPGSPGDAYNQLFIFIHIISLPFPGSSVAAPPNLRTSFLLVTPLSRGVEPLLLLLHHQLKNSVLPNVCDIGGKERGGDGFTDYVWQKKGPLG